MNPNSSPEIKPVPLWPGLVLGFVLGLLIIQAILAGPVFGQEIEGPKQVDLGDPIVLTVKDEKASGVIWTLPLGLKERQFNKGKTACIWARKAGKYDIKVICLHATGEVKDGKLVNVAITPVAVYHTLTVGTPPKPKPDPDEPVDPDNPPEPDPAPSDFAGKIKAALKLVDSKYLDLKSDVARVYKNIASDAKADSSVSAEKMKDLFKTRMTTSFPNLDAAKGWSKFFPAVNKALNGLGLSTKEQACKAFEDVAAAMK